MCKQHLWGGTLIYGYKVGNFNVLTVKEWMSQYEKLAM